MTAMISLCGVSKRYNPPHGPLALDEVSLEVEEGEILGLLGPNGAGKTTLIEILAGLFPPTEGDALVGGHSVLREPMAVKRLIGVVPQEMALYLQRSARQNLRYFGQLYGLSGRELDMAVEGVLAAVGLGERANERVARYSHGLRRRLNVGLGLLHSPRILLLDEPTVGLDPESRRRILDLVISLKRQRGTTVVFATHYIEEAQELADRVAIIHRGRVLAVGRPTDLMRGIEPEETVQPPSLESVFLHLTGETLGTEQK